MRTADLLSSLVAFIPLAALAEQRESYDYWRFDRELVRRGQQALFMCNGLFTSNRGLQQVFAQELAYLPVPIGTPNGGDYEVDRARRAVTVGADDYAKACRRPTSTI